MSTLTPTERDDLQAVFTADSRFTDLVPVVERIIDDRLGAARQGVGEQ